MWKTKTPRTLFTWGRQKIFKPEDILATCRLALAYCYEKMAI